MTQILRKITKKEIGSRLTGIGMFSGACQPDRCRQRDMIDAIYRVYTIVAGWAAEGAAFEYDAEEGVLRANRGGFSAQIDLRAGFNPGLSQRVGCNGPRLSRAEAVEHNKKHFPNDWRDYDACLRNMLLPIL